MQLLDRTASLRGLLAETGIQEFLDDKGNTEIAINRPFELWTESNKGWQRYDMPNLDYSVLLKIANTFAILNKLEITPKNPICSGVFPDEQRGQVVIPTACERGSVSITIRQPSQDRFTLIDYGRTGRLNRWIDKSTFTTANMILPSHLKDKLEAESKEIEYLNKWLDIPSDVHLQLFELQMLKAKAERDTDTFIELGIKNYANFCLMAQLLV